MGEMPMGEGPPLRVVLDAVAAAPNPAAAVDLLRRHPSLAVCPPQEAGRAARALAEYGHYGDLDLVVDLAYRAHQGGVDGAAALFANASDRACLLRGRPQRFGSLTMAHQGDLTLAPVDPTTPDEVRVRLGLPTLRARREEVQVANKARARARAATPGDTDGLPFARVWSDPTAAELRARWAAESRAGGGVAGAGASGRGQGGGDMGAWAEGDVLTFVTDRAVEGALVGPLFELPMWRPEGADHDGLWVLQVRVQRLAEAVLSYAVWPLDGDGRPAFTRRPEPDGRFRGAAAPPPPPTNDPVLGRLEDHLVDSAALGGRRAVTVYLPPNHDAAAGPYPVVYATDGQFFAPYARRVDAAIAAGRVRPLVVVAAHAASFDPAQGGNLRALEYLLGFDARRYAAHERFFVEELSAWAEARFGVAADREARAVFGCSDGGGHALTTGVFHAGRFGHVLAYSAGTPPVGSEHWESTAPPRIQLCAGTLEPAFYGATAAWSLYLSRLGVAHEFTEAVSGHELLQWVEELPASLARAFPT